MLQGPTSQSKERSDADRRAVAPEVNPREIHPRSNGADGLADGRSRAKGIGQRVSRLQQAMGNQGMLRMLSRSTPRLQTKLTVNQPGDQFEQEADQVAEQVMRMPAPSMAPEATSADGDESRLQRKCACGGSGGGCESCKEHEEEKLQRKAVSAGAPPGAAPPIVHEVLRSPGQPLDRAARAFFEQRFGCDFSGVQVHTDRRAAESARAVNAHAYAVGSHVVFGTGRYSPSTRGGAWLLAHELAHIVQQQSSPRHLPATLALDGEGNATEHAADSAADSVLADRRVPALNGSAATVQRKKITSTDKISDDERLIHYDDGSARRVRRVHWTTMEPGPANWAEATPGIDLEQVWLEIEWCAGENHGTVTVGADIPKQALNLIVSTVTSGGDISTALRGVNVTPFVQLNMLQSGTFRIEASGDVTVDLHGKVSGGEGRIGVSTGPFDFTIGAGSRNVGGRPDVNVEGQFTWTPGRQTPKEHCQRQKKHAVEHTRFECSNEPAPDKPKKPETPPPQYVPLFFNYAKADPAQPEYGDMIQNIVEQVAQGYTIATIEGETSPEGPRDRPDLQPRAPGQFVDNKRLADARATAARDSVQKALKDAIDKVGAGGDLILRQEELDSRRRRLQAALKSLPAAGRHDPAEMFGDRPTGEEIPENMMFPGLQEQIGTPSQPDILEQHHVTGDVPAEPRTEGATAASEFRTGQRAGRARPLSQAERLQAIYPVFRRALVKLDPPAPPPPDLKLTPGVVASVIGVPDPCTDADEALFTDTKAAKKEEQVLRRKAASAGGPQGAPPIVHEVLRSAGQPLDPASRAFFEPRFGCDLSGVQVHTDGRAAESAQAVNAFAYTVGRDVVFGSGQYSPSSRAGRQLLAHELAHVVQQSHGASEVIQRQQAAGIGETATAKHDGDGLTLHRRSADGQHGAGPSVAPSIVSDALHSSGRPLDAATREFFEARFGHDFSQVNIHTDATAAESARVMGAEAFTAGEDIFFAGHNAPSDSQSSRSLLAHELVHVVQGYEGRTGGSLSVSDPGSPLETEASVRGSHDMEAPVSRASGPIVPHTQRSLAAGQLLRQGGAKDQPLPTAQFEVKDGTANLSLNGTQVASGYAGASPSFNLQQTIEGSSYEFLLIIPRDSTVKFLHPQIETVLKRVAPSFRARIVKPALQELVNWELVDSIQSVAPSPTTKPPSTPKPTKAEAASAELERDFPLVQEAEESETPQPEEEEEIPGLPAQGPVNVVADQTHPGLFLAPQDATREEIASALFGDATATTDFDFEAGVPPSAIGDVPQRALRVRDPKKLKAELLDALRSQIEKELKTDVEWTIAKLKQATIGDADEWALTEMALRWSQRSEILDANGENYFDRYLDALAARNLVQPHWYTLTLTSTTHSALDWLLIETEEKVEQIQKAIALRSQRWKTSRGGEAYTVTDSSPELAPGDIVGRFYWSTGSSIRIMVAQKLVEETSFERAEIRTRNSTVWIGPRIIVPGKDGRFRGYGVLFDTILGNVHPLDDPAGHYYWYNPGTVFIRPLDYRLGVGAGTGELKDLRQSILNDTLSQSTTQKPWPMLGLDYDVLDLLTMEQRVDVFDKVINGPGINDIVGVNFLSRVLVATPDAKFPELERRLTDKGVLQKLLTSSAEGKVQLGQAFTLKALETFPLTLSSLETMPTFDIGHEGTTRYMIDVPTEQVTTSLVPPAQWDPTKGVSLSSEPAMAGEAPGPAERTALRFKPVTLSGYVSTTTQGPVSRPLHPLELVRVRIHGPQPQTRIMTAMELAMIASVTDTSAIWEAIGRISTLWAIYGGVSGLTRAIAAPVVAETALEQAEAGAAAEAAGAETAAAAAARQAAIREFIGRTLLATSMVAVDVYRDDLSKTEVGRDFLAVYDIAMVALAAHDIYKLASSGILRELGRRGSLLLQQLGGKASSGLREAIETAQDVQTTIDRLLAEKKIAITPDGATFNVPNGNETFKQVFFAVRAERAAERTVSGLRGAGLTTETSERVLASLQKSAEKGEEFAKAYNAVARRAASMRPAEVDGFLSAVDSLRSASPAKAQPALAELLKTAGKAHVVDPVAFLKDAEWLVTRPGLDPETVLTLAQKTGARRPLDLNWLRSTGLTTEDLNFMGRDPNTNWDSIRRAAGDPTNKSLQIQVRSRIRGIAGEMVTQKAASKLFPEYRLTGRQVELQDGHIVDFELTTKDGTSIQHALEVKGWTGDKWREALNAWDHNLETGAKLSKEEEGLVKQMQGVIDQLNDATKAPRGKPFLVVTKGLSGPTRGRLTKFLATNARGTEVRAISEEEILETTKRLRAAFGLPEKLPEGEE